MLSCVYRLAQRKLSFGETVVADILKGRSDAKIKSFELDTLSTYGIMSTSPISSIKSIIRFMEDEGCLAKNEYSSLDLTSRARAVLIERKPVVMKVPKGSLNTARKPKAAKASAGTSRPELFWRLRSLRNKKAQEENLPAYIIFNDSSLRDMCEKLPKTFDEFLTVSGVGEVKCRKYSAEFTAEIIDYLKNNNEE